MTSAEGTFKLPLRPKCSAARLCASIALLLSPSCADRASATVKLATTTSTENSGLLDVLLPVFEKSRGVKVHVIAVGTGRAIKHGENGDVDVILVHAPAAEERFVEEGYGISRREVMSNDFVILGPGSDPAGVRGMKDAASALAKIAEAGGPFVSRGDDSGTHKKEKRLWAAARVAPGGGWYLSAGQGMGACLTIADEKRGYVLTDRATYLAFRDRLGLRVLVESDPRLRNPYAVIAVNPARHPHVRHAEAMEFIEWLTSTEGQWAILGHKIGGEILFYPTRLE